MDDDAKLAEHGAALAEAITAALPGWVERSVARVAGDGRLAEQAAAAGRAAADEAGPALRALLGADVDDQRGTPLTVVRAAVRWPTGVLREAGVPPVERDGFERATFPDDDFGLTPATLGELDPELTELALAWGAAKAWVHRRRHLDRPAP